MTAVTYLRDHLTALVDSGWLSAPVPEEFGGRGRPVDARSLRGRQPTGPRRCGLDHRREHAPDRRRQPGAPVPGGGDDAQSAGLGVVLDQLVADRRGDRRCDQRAGTGPHPTVHGRRCRWRSLADRRHEDLLHHVAGSRRVPRRRSPSARTTRRALRLRRDPRRAPGVVVHDDWDALGMRTSGSNSVSFTDVRVEASAFMGGFPSGSAVGYAARTWPPAGSTPAALGCGIAESGPRQLRSSGLCEQAGGRRVTAGSGRWSRTTRSTSTRPASALSRAGDVARRATTRSTTGASRWRRRRCSPCSARCRRPRPW